MIKYILYLLLGYLVFKVAKNGINLISNRLNTPKEINQPDTLEQCKNCEKYIDKDLTIRQKGHVFCSENCCTEFFSEKS